MRALVPLFVFLSVIAAIAACAAASGDPEPTSDADALRGPSASTPSTPPAHHPDAASGSDAASDTDGSAHRPHPKYLLSADGVTDTYALLGAVLGGTPIDGTDCAHPAFGHHIAQSWDAELGTHVFDFFIHVTPDNDRCASFDRQRNEIKVHDGSPAALKGFSGDTVTYQWKFRLDAHLQASPSFFHIHQIKGGDGAGAGAAPLITLTPRAGNPAVLQLIYSSPAQAESIFKSVPIAPLLGTWVEANETIRYEASGNGTYAITLRRVSDGATLFAYSSTSLATWALSTAASPTTYCRPKWGIYRSLKNASALRDEVVHFDDFCIAKNGASCPIDLP